MMLHKIVKGGYNEKTTSHLSSRAQRSGDPGSISLLNNHMKILRFGADWCPACIVMRGVWSKVEETAPWLASEYYDYDSATDKVKEYEVSDKLPTFIFIDNHDQEILRLQGEFSADKLLEVIEEHKEK